MTWIIYKLSRLIHDLQYCPSVLVALIYEHMKGCLVKVTLYLLIGLLWHSYSIMFYIYDHIKEYCGYLMFYIVLRGAVGKTRGRFYSVECGNVKSMNYPRVVISSSRQPVIY